MFERPNKENVTRVPNPELRDIMDTSDVEFTKQAGMTVKVMGERGEGVWTWDRKGHFEGGWGASLSTRLHKYYKLL